MLLLYLCYFLYDRVKEKDKFNFICVSIKSGKVNDREDIMIYKNEKLYLYIYKKKIFFPLKWKMHLGENSNFYHHCSLFIYIPCAFCFCGHLSFQPLPFIS